MNRTRMWSAIVVVVLVAVVAQAATASARTRVATPPGSTVATVTGLFLSDSYPLRQFDRSLCKAPNVCAPLAYRNNGSESGTADGVARLDRWIRSTPGQKIVHGYSLGATVTAAWLRKYSADPTAPGPDQLTFILAGNPERAGTGSMIGVAGYTGVPATTRYRVIDVCRQYDSVCDKASPAPRGTNGFGIHLDYNDVDLDAESNVVSVSGNITSVLVPKRGR